MATLRAVPDLAGLDRAETVEALRRSMAQMGAAVPVAAPETAVPAGGEGSSENRATPLAQAPAPAPPPGAPAAAPTPATPTPPSPNRVPAPPAFAGILGGGLPRGAISAIDSAGAVVAALLAQVTAAGGYVAVVGLPDFGALSIAEHGGDLRRVLAVPEPGDNPLEVISLLADGVDLIAAELPRTPSPSMVRPVAARLRSSGCAVLAVGEAWPTVRLRMSSAVVAVHGVGAGHGRIRGVEYRVAAAGAGLPERRVVWRVGDCGSSASDAVGESRETEAAAPLRRVD